MKTYISTYPSLGQVSVIDHTIISLIALLEVENISDDIEWQVSLWHSDEEAGDWEEKPLNPLQNISDQPMSFSGIENPSKLKRLFFTTTLKIQLTSRFAIKFRNNTEQSWTYSRDLDTPDGIIVVKSKPSENDFLGDLDQFIHGLNPCLKRKKCLVKDSNILLWQVEASIEACEGEMSRIESVEFGTPWGEEKVLRWMAIVRNGYPWLAPRQGVTRFELDNEAIMCSFLNHQGKHLVLLAVNGIDDVTTLLTSSDKGTVVMRVRNDAARNAAYRVIVGVGDDFESVVAVVMDYARDIVTNLQGQNRGQRKQQQTLCKDMKVTQSNHEDWYDGLTFCTWNALGQKLTDEKLMTAVTSLAQNKVNITNFIIDDNWQAIDYRGNNQYTHGWIEFEAEKNNFPNGLKHTIERIRDQHPSIKNVAVWHAILGYWGGLAPDGRLAKTYNTVKVERTDTRRENLPADGKITVVAKEDIAKFYDDFYRFLSSCGVNAVKTDVQSMLDTFVSAEVRRDLITSYLDAWILSASHYFGHNVISCMSQTPQSLFYSHLPLNKPRFMIRNSDDFNPENLASHPWHIFSNAHNTLFTQHLNALPDWDMFQTVHKYSAYHAAARCVSGGPIYITDVPVQHDLNLIDQITSLTPRGKTIILRPSMIGRSLDQYTKFDDCKLLQIGTYHEKTGIIGFFNICQKYCSEMVPLTRFPGVKNGSQYVVRTHSTGAISKPLQLFNSNPLICVSLNTRGFDILSAYPLNKVVIQDQNDEMLIANLGLLGKMTGAAAVVENRLLPLENGVILFETRLKALGVLGFYVSSLKNRTIRDNLSATISGKALPEKTIKVSEVDAHIIEIDIATAWRELELTSGEKNEVVIQLKIS